MQRSHEVGADLSRRDDIRKGTYVSRALHGMNGIAEAVRLIRGDSVNQPEKIENVLATAGTAVPTSALLLSQDR